MPAAPVHYSEAIATEICDHIATGKSLRSYCEQPGTPSFTSVKRWLRDLEDFRAQYASAREDQADVYADEIVEISDTEEDANRARVRIDARKWAAGKLKPKKYGDKLALSGDGEGSPIQVRHDVEFHIIDPAPKG